MAGLGITVVSDGKGFNDLCKAMFLSSPYHKAFYQAVFKHIHCNASNYDQTGKIRFVIRSVH